MAAKQGLQMGSFDLACAKVAVQVKTLVPRRPGDEVELFWL